MLLALILALGSTSTPAATLATLAPALSVTASQVADEGDRSQTTGDDPLPKPQDGPKVRGDGQGKRKPHKQPWRKHKGKKRHGKQQQGKQGGRPPKLG